MASVETAGEIGFRLSHILASDECKAICFAGIFGDLRREIGEGNGQINMIVWYNPESTSTEIACAIANFANSEYLEALLGRKVSILHVFGASQVRTYAELDAILTCEKIYGSEAWLEEQQNIAFNFLVDGYTRLRKACQLLEQIQGLICQTDKSVWSKVIPLTNLQEFFVDHKVRNSFLPDVCELVSLLNFRDDHPFSRWNLRFLLDPLKTKWGLIRRWRDGYANDYNTEEIWKLLVADCSINRIDENFSLCWYANQVENTCSRALIWVPELRRY